MIPVVVQSGDTLSGIAAQYGTTYQAIAAASGIANPNLIFAGQTVEVPSGGGATPVQSSYTPPQTPSSTSYTPAPVASSSGGLDDVPGVPSSFAACVAFRESTDGELSSNVYGIIPASGYDGYGASLAQQKQDFAALYKADGTQPWAPSDGC
jgi:murein DD-endopeptidase MepM/ murein hydrolase activator NlpD